MAESVGNNQTIKLVNYTNDKYITTSERLEEFIFRVQVTIRVTE